MRRGFKGSPRVCRGSRPSIEFISTLPRLKKLEECIFVIVKPPPIFITLYITEENIYGHITEFSSCVDVSAFVDMNETN